MRTLPAFFFCLFGFISILGQTPNFLITRDIIDINIEGHMGQSLIIGDKFYCFFTRHAPYSVSDRKMYILSSDGKIEHCIDSLPKEFYSYYSDFHLRDGEVLLKTYYDEKDTYVFDNEKLKWQKTNTVDDLIYEDEQFYVTSLYFGEWGGATWFKNKNTGKEYRLGISTPKVNRLNNTYYLSLDNIILEVKNPLELHECSQEEYYGYTVENKKFYDELYYSQGAEIIYEDKANDSYYTFLQQKCPSYIRTSFVSNDKLYHLLVDSCKLYIAELQEGKLRKIQTIGSGSSFSRYHSRYRCLTQKDGSQIIKVTDDNVSGLMKIKRDSISIYYFRNEYDKKFKQHGKKKTDAIFKEFFASVFSNYDNENIYQIRDYHKNINQAIDITGLNDNSEIDNSRMIFSVVEDSIFTHEISYMYSLRDSLPKRSLYVWKDYTMSWDKKEDAERIRAYERRFNEVKQFIRQYLVDSNLMKKQNNSEKYSVQWETTTGNTIDLHIRGKDKSNSGEIRLFIDYGKKQ